MAKAPRIKTKDTEVRACPRGVLPVLYKKTTGGRVQSWEIWVTRLKSNGYGKMYTRYGLVDGQQQEIQEIISEGKNEGRGNATTPYEQACLEAAARWDKQRNRKGYAEDPTGAASAAIRSVSPMLAQKFQDHEKKVNWDTALAQPKLNGFRCIVRVVEGKLVAFSRENQVLEVPHVLQALRKPMLNEGIMAVDGELYTHGMSLNVISSACKKLSKLTEQIQYNIYDTVTDEAYAKRIKDLHLKLCFGGDARVIQMVETVKVRTRDELMTAQAEFVGQGYEGAMLRHGDAGYESGRRSSYLLKVKTFLDAEFKVVDYKYGRGKMAKVPIFTCVTDEGHHFDVLPQGTMEERHELGEKAGSLLGSMLTVKYQEMTKTAEPVPFHPVGIGFREEG